MKSGTVGSWIRWGIFGAIAVWTIILCILSKDMLRVVDINNDSERRIELEQELSDTKRLVKLLQEEKDKLQKLSDEQGYILKNSKQGSGGKFDSQIQKIKDKLVVDEKSGKSKSNGELYSLEHEIAKRSLDNNIKEIYFYVYKFIEEHNSTELSAFGKRAIEQLLALLAESTNFSESVDDAGKWHKSSLDSLTKRIQDRITELQNPSDCSSQRLLICDLNKGCGFGCQLHHVAYCFVVAAAANRSLVLENDGTQWRYSAKGWESVFLPVGKCKISNSGITGSASWNGLDQEERVVRLPIVDGLTNRPPQLPLSFPKQIADEILKHHTNPPAYFISQFIWYLMRNNENMEKAITEAKEKVPFGINNEPIVGIQVRRTDKIGTEASFHSVEEYMKWTEHWFRIQELRNDTKMTRKVFVATDDPSVFKEIREKYSDYKVYGDASIAETAQMNSRYTDSSLYGVIIDIQMLSHCDYLVCTFSSQVCRMGFELMQVRRGDAGHLFHSLDDIYYYGGQHSHEEIATLSHKPASDAEFEFEVGDSIGIAGNHWDGFSKGVNRRTGQSGLYPSYKTRESWRIVDFPLFNNL